MEGYEPYYSLESEGYRLAVMTCSRCGAAVILDSTEEGPRIHDAWHGGKVATDAAAEPELRSTRRERSDAGG